MLLKKELDFRGLLHARVHILSLLALSIPECCGMFFRQMLAECNERIEQAKKNQRGVIQMDRLQISEHEREKM